MYHSHMRVPDGDTIDYNESTLERRTRICMRRITENSASKLAASLGYSRTYRDELAQLEVPMSLYDAFYRWCGHAGNETHA